ncbi:hypothetical protein BJX76DRAFT_359259 [Aspergillus varians]
MLDLDDMMYEDIAKLNPPHEDVMYEDIAKLNPFYEEYKAFWDDPRDISDTSSYMPRLSSSSSLPSNTSDSESPSAPIDMAVSPLFRPGALALPDSSFPESSKFTFYSGCQGRPTYDKHHGLERSHIVIVDEDEDEIMKRLLSPIRDELGVPIDPVDHALGYVRSSHKQLFGSNGLLGRTAELEAPLRRTSTYKGLVGLGKKVKQHVGEIATDMVNSHPFIFHGSCQAEVLPKLTVAISLDPTAQASLYGKIESTICNIANSFLVEQYNAGRISRKSIKKVNKFWGSRNRAAVVEFQFDQLTQCQLISENIETMKFNKQGPIYKITKQSYLRNWEVAAKEMSIRTFCYPDSVIRKHMFDIQRVLVMLGIPQDNLDGFEELQEQTLRFMKKRRANSHLSEGGQSVSSGQSDSPRTSCSSH